MLGIKPKTSHTHKACVLPPNYTLIPLGCEALGAANFPRHLLPLPFFTFFTYFGLASREDFSPPPRHCWLVWFCQCFLRQDLPFPASEAQFPWLQ